MREYPNGSTVLAVIPCSAPSMAITLAKPVTPALAAA
jgi:hypothetical protein